MIEENTEQLLSGEAEQCGAGDGWGTAVGTQPRGEGLAARPNVPTAPGEDRAGSGFTLPA